MYYQHAKHLGWRRYDDKIAIIGCLHGDFTLLSGPAASLWEQLEKPTSLIEAAQFYSRSVAKPVSERALEKALAPLLDKGVLRARESAEALASSLHDIPTARGVYVEDMVSGFYREMRDHLFPNQMLKADLEINSACNLRCVHCYITDYKDRNLMGMDEICKLFDELAEIGVMFVNLTGGEMTLRSDFVDIIQEARNRHFVVSILSNATRFSDETLARLAVSSPNNVYVSLYGVDAEAHEFITDRAGTFDATMENVHRLRQQGIPVVLRYLIMRHNVEQVAALPAFADEHDCLYTTSSNLFVVDGPKDFLDQHRITNEQMLWLWSKGLTKEPKKGVCTAGKQRVRIDAKGNVYPCELLRLNFGNVRQASLIDIMSEYATLNQIKDIHTTPQGCSSCSKHEGCPRCPGLAHHEDGNMRGNSSHACRVTDNHRELDAYRTLGSQPHPRPEAGQERIQLRVLR